MQATNQIRNVQNTNISQNPIFVVGCPRSGTTLLQALLATQHNIISFPETHFFTKIWSYIEVDELGFIKSDSLPKIFAQIQDRSGVTFDEKIRSTLVDLCQNHSLTRKTLFEYVVNHYLPEDSRKTTIRWLEKTPEHVLHLDTISQMYPNAMFVNIIREPLAVILSIKQTGMSKEKTIHGFSLRWKATVDSYEAFKAKYPDRIYGIAYEQLVASPSETMNGICNFLGIKFDSSKLEDHATVAKGVIQPKETWKKNNLNTKIENANAKHHSPFWVRLITQYFLEPYMVKYHYPVKLKWLQPIFNILFGAIYTNRKLFKALLTRTD